MAVKCDITTFVLQKLNSLRYGFNCHKNTQREIIRSYVEYLNCSTAKLENCKDAVCDNEAIISECMLQIQSITLNILSATDIVFSVITGDYTGGTLPFTYEWGYNTEDFELTSGTAQDSELKLTAKPEKDLNFLNSLVSVAITDEQDCLASKSCYITPEGMICDPDFLPCDNPQDLVVT